MAVKLITYWASKILFAILILTFVINYLFDFENTFQLFIDLGYPEHLIRPLVVANVLGLYVIITNMGQWLLEWAYAGFFFNFIFAIIGHYVTIEGNGIPAVIGLVLLITIYVLNKELENKSTKPIIS